MLMKFVLIILFLGMMPEYTPAPSNCIEEYFHKTDSRYAEVYERTESRNEYGIRHMIDSLNFSITRRWTYGGTPIIECVSNNLTQIELWKGYHPNGELEETGYKTHGCNTPIGTWVYFSDSGYLDSVVHQDERYGMSFCEIIAVAESRGLYDSTSSIRFYRDTKKWEVVKWTPSIGCSQGTGISVHVGTGKIEELFLVSVH